MQVLTKDSVTVSVDAVVYYRVSNATVSVANVEDAHSSTRYVKTHMLATHAAIATGCWLRLLSGIFLALKICMRYSVIGRASQAPCRQDQAFFLQPTISSLQVVLDEATGSWGIKVERVEM